jgi:DNA-directed RNA polymerase specialized sigma subunit
MAYNKRSNGIRWVEKLLRKQKFLKVELINQERALQLNQIEQKEAIEGQYLKANTYGDRVQTSSIGSTGLFAGDEFDFLSLEHRTIEQRIEYLNILLASLEDALAELKEKELKILMLFYKDGLRIVDISFKVYLSVPHVNTIKRRALCQLAIALRPFWNDAIM